MSIAEIPIESKQKFKKYSIKTQKSVETFLTKMGVSVDDLSDDQKKHIFDHIKVKRTFKLYVPTVIFFALMNIGLIFGFKATFNVVNDILFDPPAAEVIEDDGSTKVRKITPDELEMQKNYGFICGVVASGMTATLFSAITMIAACISMILKSRSEAKIFKAFLPSLKTCPQE